MFMKTLDRVSNAKSTIRVSSCVWLGLRGDPGLFAPPRVVHSCLCSRQRPTPVWSQKQQICRCPEIYLESASPMGLPLPGALFTQLVCPTSLSLSQFEHRFLRKTFLSSHWSSPFPSKARVTVIVKCLCGDCLWLLIKSISSFKA